MASTKLQKTFSSDSNRQKWTWSGWIKRTGLGGIQTLMTQVDGWNGNGNAGFYIIDDQLTSYNFTSSLNSGTDSYNRPLRYLRDVNGWYHIVVRLDTTQSTASDRCRWYVNGEQLTDFVYANYPSLNQECNFNGGDPHGIGAHTTGTGNYFDGIMTHVYFADGQSYAPTVFGETDASTGQWKIITVPSVTYGTHGFSILKDTNSGTDQSGQGNNFAVTGTLTKTEDNPANVFSTMNSQANYAQQWALFENGSNYVRSAGTGEAYLASTLGIPATSGKYYAEVKYTAGGTSSQIGIVEKPFPESASYAIGQTSADYSYQQDGQLKTNDGNESYGNAYTTGNIIGIAVDATNSKLYFSVNGVWQNSGDPTSGSTGTGAISMSATPQSGFYFMACAKYGGTTKNYYAWNFGNGYFQTTTVASAGTNASGNGIFEYDVPTGYTALSTKGLNL